MRPFRFIADLSSPVVDGDALAEKARRAQGAGYDTVTFGDHLLDQFAPIPALATVAAAAESVRIGMFVLNNDLRHPAVLAQDLATLDVLSGGRLEIGIGAGWNDEEYAAAGMAFDPPAVRIARLEEAIGVLKGLFGQAPFSFEGTYYTIRGMDGQPKPVQQPHPPFLIGGGGRRVLALAAREAATIGLAPRAVNGPNGQPLLAEFLAPAAVDKMAWVRESAGDRFDNLDLNVYPALGPLVVTADRRAEAEKRAQRLSARAGMALTPEQVLESPFAFIGSVDQLAETLVERRERFGINSVTVFEPDVFAPVVERLAGT